MESVDETPLENDYYDGSKNLNVVKIQCKLYRNASDCIHQSSCGWCGCSNSCILGNSKAPLQPCLKSSFVFSPTYPNRSPQTKVGNDQVGGVSLTI